MSSRKILLGAAAALALSAGGVSQAHALTVTWNPGGASPALGTLPPGIGASGNAFTFTSLAVGDYAQITTNGTGGFTESGYLAITGANLGSTFFTPVGIGGVTGGSNGGGVDQTSGRYTLYFQFNATGTTFAPNVITPGNFPGSFSTLSYTLYGVNGNSSFSVAGGNPTVNNNGNTPVQLASGSLITGGANANTVNLSVALPPAGQNPSPGSTLQLNPTADNLNLTFIPVSGENGFFVDPSATMSLQFTGSFTNDPQIVTAVSASQLAINGGRGTMTPQQAAAVTTPEPASIALIGSAMLGLGLIRRKRRES